MSLLRPPLLQDLILVPTRRIVGIEDPFLQSPEAPNYFDAAWRARSFLKGANGQAPDREAVALVANSAFVRTQDQLHIHVGCLFPSAQQRSRGGRAGGSDRRMDADRRRRPPSDVLGDPHPGSFRMSNHFRSPPRLLPTRSGTEGN